MIRRCAAVHPKLLPSSSSHLCIIAPPPPPLPPPRTLLSPLSLILRLLPEHYIKRRVDCSQEHSSFIPPLCYAILSIAILCYPNPKCVLGERSMIGTIGTL